MKHFSGSRIVLGALFFSAVTAFFVVHFIVNERLNTAWKDADTRQERFLKNPHRPLHEFDIATSFDRSQVYENAYAGMRVTFPRAWHTEEFFVPSRKATAIALFHSSGVTALSSALIVQIRPSGTEMSGMENAYPLLKVGNSFFATEPYDPSDVVGSFYQLGDGEDSMFLFRTQANGYVVDVRSPSSEWNREEFLAFVAGIEFFTPTDALPSSLSAQTSVHDQACRYSIASLGAWRYEKNTTCTPLSPFAYDRFESALGLISVADTFESEWVTQYDLLKKSELSGFPTELYRANQPVNGYDYVYDLILHVQRPDRPLLFLIHGVNERANQEILQFVQQAKLL